MCAVPGSSHGCHTLYTLCTPIVTYVHGNVQPVQVYSPLGAPCTLMYTVWPQAWGACDVPFLWDMLLMFHSECCIRYFAAALPGAEQGTALMYSPLSRLIGFMKQWGTSCGWSGSLVTCTSTGLAQRY